MRAPSPPAVFLAALAGQLALHALLPASPGLPWPARAAGAGMALAGIVLHARAYGHFRRRGAPVATLEAPDALVTDGPFRVSRNPMYLAGVVILAGLALLYGGPAPWLAPPAFAAVAAAAWIAPEERMLSHRFGAAWDAYRARVGRWLGPVPRWG